MLNKPSQIRSMQVLLRRAAKASMKHLDRKCVLRMCSSKASSLPSSSPPPPQESEALPWPLILEPSYKFTEFQQQLRLGDPNIAEIVADKTARKKFFYGIETKPMDVDDVANLDFNIFQPQQPVFISIVWTRKFSEFIDTTTMKNVPNIQLMHHLHQHIPAMPHMTLFRVTQKLLDDFLALKLNNVLIIRGDHVEEGQEYSYSTQAVEYLRRAAGKNLAIAVAGYPEGYTNLRTGPWNKEQDMEYLRQKVEAGADFIVTQMCYCGDKIVEFLQDARNAGITVPIMLGILIPETYARYQRMKGFSSVELTPKQLEELEAIKEDDATVQQYFVQLSVGIIKQALDSDLGVYGIHFYTLNRFSPVLDALNELRRLGILTDDPKDCEDAAKVSKL